MGKVYEELNKVQSVLHDGGKIWTRDELVDWFNDGYRRLLGQTHAVKRLVCMDVPPRFPVTMTYQWETRYAYGSNYTPFFSILNNDRKATYQWEAEQAEGETTTNSLSLVTHPWERSFVGVDVDQHYQFVLPRNSEKIKRVAWDDERLSPITVRELDETRDNWFNRDGEPNWWTTGTGKNRTIEVFEIESTYNQAYKFQNGLFGLTRNMSGSRTYSTVEVTTKHPSNFYAFTSTSDIDYFTNRTPSYYQGHGWRFTQDVSNGYHGTQVWEKEMQDGTDSADLSTGATVGTYGWEVNFGAQTVNFGLGPVRELSSTARQYLPVAEHTGEYFVNGTIRDMKSTASSISVIESIVPGFNLGEGDLPDLVPAQMVKYIRYYVLMMAFGRTGEGYNPSMAEHYDFRWNRGLQFMERLANLTSRDREYQRTHPSAVRGRPPRVQLPSTYPRVLF